MECYSAIAEQLCEQNPQLNPVFKGKHACTIVCGHCENNSDRSENFSDICLYVNALGDQCNVEEGLKQFVQPDIIDNYQCEICKSISPSTKTMRIREAPKVLSVRMNRFNPQMTDKKINKFVAYPPVLDISNYMETKPKTPRLYALYSIIVHRGVCNSYGHYFSFVKTAGQWYKADDSRVREVDQSTVLKQGGAYVLFYKEVNCEEAVIKTVKSVTSDNTLCQSEVKKNHVGFVEKNLISKATNFVKKSLKVGKNNGNHVKKAPSDANVTPKPAKAGVKGSVNVDKCMRNQAAHELKTPGDSNAVKNIATSSPKSNGDCVQTEQLPNKPVAQEAESITHRQNPAVNNSFKVVKSPGNHAPKEYLKMDEFTVVKDNVTPNHKSGKGSVQKNHLPKRPVLQEAKSTAHSENSAINKSVNMDKNTGNQAQKNVRNNVIQIPKSDEDCVQKNQLPKIPIDSQEAKFMAQMESPVVNESPKVTKNTDQAQKEFTLRRDNVFISRPKSGEDCVQKNQLPKIPIIHEAKFIPQRRYPDVNERAKVGNNTNNTGDKARKEFLTPSASSIVKDMVTPRQKSGEDSVGKDQLPKTPVVQEAKFIPQRQHPDVKESVSMGKNIGIPQEFLKPREFFTQRQKSGEDCVQKNQLPKIPIVQEAKFIPQTQHPVVNESSKVIKNTGGQVQKEFTHKRDTGISRPKSGEDYDQNNQLPKIPINIQEAKVMTQRDSPAANKSPKVTKNTDRAQKQFTLIRDTVTSRPKSGEDFIQKNQLPKIPIVEEATFIPQRRYPVINKRVKVGNNTNKTGDQAQKEFLKPGASTIVNNIASPTPKSGKDSVEKDQLSKTPVVKEAKFIPQRQHPVVKESVSMGKNIGIQIPQESLKPREFFTQRQKSGEDCVQKNQLPKIPIVQEAKFIPQKQYPLVKESSKVNKNTGDQVPPKIKLIRDSVIPSPKCGEECVQKKELPKKPVVQEANERTNVAKNTGNQMPKEIAIAAETIIAKEIVTPSPKPAQDCVKINQLPQKPVLQKGKFMPQRQTPIVTKASINVGKNVQNRVTKEFSRFDESTTVTNNPSPKSKRDCEQMNHLPKKPAVEAKSIAHRHNPLANGSVRVGETLGIQRQNEHVVPGQSTISPKSTKDCGQMKQPPGKQVVQEAKFIAQTKIPDVSESVKVGKYTGNYVQREYLQPSEFTVQKDIVTQRPKSGEGCVSMNHMSGKHFVQESKVNAQRQSPVQFTNIKADVLRNSAQLNTRVVGAVPTCEGVSLAYSPPESYQTTPYLASITKTPKPSRAQQSRMCNSSQDCNPGKSVPMKRRTGGIYDTDSGYSHKNVVPNSPFQLQPPLSTSQSVLTESNTPSAKRMRFATPKPVVSHSVPIQSVQVAQKRKLKEVDECHNGLGAKCQRIDIIRVPEGMVKRQAEKRKAEYHCPNGPSAKVMRMENSVCFKNK